MGYLIDTHFHLDHYKNYKELATQINALQQYTICVTNSPGVFHSCKNLISENKYLKFAIGFHPQEKALTNRDLDDFMRLIDRTNYVGEIGIDLSSRSYRNEAAQIASFEQIVKTCTIKNKLMTVHIRRAEEQALRIITKYSPSKCIIHWFTGTSDQLQQFIDAGCYFSVNANMISAKTNHKYLSIPVDRLLVESDGPYTRVNGKRYIPTLLQEAYSQIAQFYNNPDFILHVYNNFKLLLSS